VDGKPVGLAPAATPPVHRARLGPSALLHAARADCAAIGGPGAAVGGWDRFDPDRRRPMPRAYSTDLRERALAAYEAGEGRQSEVARLYRIGERTLSGWLKLAREEGRRSPKARRGGTRPVGGEAATLAALVAERNDATLAEYADLLADRTGVRRSPSALCRALKALGLVRKKRRSRPPSGTGRTWPRRGPRGAPSWPASIPPA
jgi:transposase